MALRYPRTARLLRPADFRALRERSQRVGSAHFTAQYRANTLDGARLGMAVSRKVSKSAVARNRVRRQIRESFRLHHASLPPADMLIVARISTATLPLGALRTDLALLWQRLITAAAAVTLKISDQPGTMRASSNAASE